MTTNNTTTLATEVLTPRQSLPAARETPATMELAPAGRGCPHLSEALALARDRCKAAPKTAVNSHHGYKYSPADEVIHTATVALTGSGLALLPISEELTVVGSGQMAFYALSRKWLLSHSSDEFVPLEVRGWPVIPDRGRPLDKAYAIALTSSLAYKLRDLLLMPRGDQFDDVAAQDDTQTPPAPSPAEQAGGSDPNAQAAPATALEPARITPKQRATLVSLIQTKGRTAEEVHHLLASRNLKVLDQLPESLVPWATALLTNGQVTTAQLDRIASLIEGRKLDWQAVASRLQQKYGVDRLALLTCPQADEIEKALAPTVAA